MRQVSETHHSLRRRSITIIALTRAWDAERVAAEIGAEWRVIVSDPPLGSAEPGIERVGRHLHLHFHDVVEPVLGRTPAVDAQIDAVAEFTREWSGSSAMVVNCYAGVSRSPAVLIIIRAILNPGREQEIVQAVKEKAPHAEPNRRVIRIADGALGCGGRLVDAVANMAGPSTRGFSGTSIFPTALAPVLERT